MSINRTNNSMNIGAVLSPAAIEALKNELFAESGLQSGGPFGDEVIKYLLLEKYVSQLEVQIVPNPACIGGSQDDLPGGAYDAAKIYDGYDFWDEIQRNPEDIVRQNSAKKVRLRRRNAYLAKKAISRKAQIANKSKRSRWLHDWSTHRGYVLVMGSEAIEAGVKGSKTERMWRLNKKAKKIGMADNATT